MDNKKRNTRWLVQTIHVYVESHINMAEVCIACTVPDMNGKNLKKALQETVNIPVGWFVWFNGNILEIKGRLVNRTDDSSSWNIVW